MRRLADRFLTRLTPPAGAPCVAETKMMC